MSSNKKALGRGFESLIPTELFDEMFDPTRAEDAKLSSLVDVSLSKIVIDPNQPRKLFKEDALESLAESIKNYGVLQPIVLVKMDDKYQIVAGERRYRASLMAGLDKIPAIVRTLSSQNKLELSLIENIQREELNVIEIATGYLKLRDQFNMSLNEIAEKVGGKSISAISNTLRLLKLPHEVIELLSGGLLTEGQARPLIGLDKGIASKLAKLIVKHGWSARRIEQVVSELDVKTEKSDLEKFVRVISTKDAKKMSAEISKRLSTEVRVKTSKNGTGSVVIAFKNIDDLNRIKSFLK